jgi:hypothetical protein
MTWSNGALLLLDLGSGLFGRGFDQQFERIFVN